MKAVVGDHEKKAVKLADKIAGKAEDTLASLKREMELNKWPLEFRKIMWDAVALVAARYAATDEDGNVV